MVPHSEPRASEAAGDRLAPGGDMVAWSTSLGLHLLVLSLLAAVSIVLPAREPDLELTYQKIELIDDELLPQEFLSIEQPSDKVGALSQAGDQSARAAAMVVDDESLVVFEPEAVTDFGERMVIEIDQPVFRGPEFSDDLPVQGAGSVGTTGAVGAIDRITHEIMISVEQRPTLVVWLFDQSGSLREERVRILKRFRGIYDQLGVIEAAADPAFRQHKDKPLLTAVVGFGEVPQMLTSEPTDQIDQIEAAIRKIKDDQTGRENVFQAVEMSAEKFRSYRSPRHGNRNVMIVVFTDEAGDDVDRLDATIKTCQKLGVSVYVVGRPAPFGRPSAYVKWIDPDPNFDQRPQWVPVSMGPESMMPERLKLYFLGAGSRDDLLDSGYGPFALTRLCYETGGLYFSAHPNRAVGRYVTGRETNNLAAHISAFFDPSTMRRYQPEYTSANEYRQLLRSNRARGGLVAAAQLSWTTPLEDVRTRFPKRDDATLIEILSIAQRNAADRQPKINRLCEVLRAGEADRDQLRRPRWRAGYDLAIGRALAAKVRTDGYSVMLAKAKQGMEFAGEKNNTWVIAADSQFVDAKLEKLADEAEKYLARVLEEHPDTPWALMAERELRKPLGWRWDESYTYMRPPTETANNTPPRPPRPEPRPTRPPRRNPPPL